MLKKIPASFYPNVFTVGNLFCGFLAIIAAFNAEFINACWLIILGGVFDAVDGKVARMVNGSSEFGIQYDSLADVVTFGVAPTTLMFNLLNAKDNWLLTAIAFLPLLFASLRLARFNVQLKGADKTEFNGLPSPAGALSIISMIPFSMFLVQNNILSAEYLSQHLELYIAFIAIFSVLMMSTVRYETPPNFTFKGTKENTIKLIIFICAVPLLVLYPYASLFPLMVLFSLQGIIRKLFN